MIRDVRTEWKRTTTNHEEHEGHEDKGVQEDRLLAYIKVVGVGTRLLMDFNVMRLKKGIIGLVVQTLRVLRGLR